jgi:uncharacterized protein YjbI with pentapeptide repeats
MKRTLLYSLLIIAACGGQIKAAGLFEKQQPQGSLNDLETLKRTGTCGGCDLRGFNITEAIKQHRGGIFAGIYARLGWNQGSIWLPEANLEGANLTGANLEYSQLSGANLRNANLQNVNLHGANLKGTNLKYADLRYSDLGSTNLDLTKCTGANFEWAKLRNASLRAANLIGANFKNANLGGASFNFSNLTNAIFKRTILMWQMPNFPKPSTFTEADITGANFKEVKEEIIDESGTKQNNLGLEKVRELLAKAKNRDKATFE